MSEWKPIETAPRDGRMILLYNVAHDEQQVLGWTDFVDEIFEEGAWTNSGSSNKAVHHVTNPGYYQYWMPLPPKP